MSVLATAEPWDLVAAAYTVEALPYFELFSREALRLAALPEGARIADVAAGPGTLSLIAAAAGASVSAIDLSPEMVAQFRARVAAAGLESAIDVRVGDGQQLPFETASLRRRVLDVRPDVLPRSRRRPPRDEARAEARADAR